MDQRHVSVTTRIKNVKQPWGGFVPLKSFNVIELDDGQNLSPVESIHGSLVGLVVDYLSRMVIDPGFDFDISLQGADIADDFASGVKETSWLSGLTKLKGARKVAKKFREGIKGLDDGSIRNACKLATFDVWKRNTVAAIYASTYQDIDITEETVHNIRVLTERTIHFYQTYGPIKKTGFTFEPHDATIEQIVEWNAKRHYQLNRLEEFGGYTDTVSSGDGDILTEDTLWDLKVTKSMGSKHSLQVICYYLMGKRSGQEIFKDITKVGLFNPRYNKVYMLPVERIPKGVLYTIEKEVLGYKKTKYKKGTIKEKKKPRMPEDEPDYKPIFPEELSRKDIPVFQIQSLKKEDTDQQGKSSTKNERNKEESIKKKVRIDTSPININLDEWNGLDTYSFLVYAARKDLTTADYDKKFHPEYIIAKNEEEKERNRQIVEQAFLKDGLTVHEKEACLLRYKMGEPAIGRYQKRGRSAAHRGIRHGLAVIRRTIATFNTENRKRDT